MGAKLSINEQCKIYKYFIVHHLFKSSKLIKFPQLIFRV